MNTQILKKVNENLPNPVKKVLSSVIRKRLIESDTFRNQYTLLLQFEKLTAQEQKRMQTDLLEKVLIDAYENTPVYKKLFDDAGYNVFKSFDEESFRRIPIQTKADIRSHFNGYISSGHHNYYVAYTGGTTGEPLKVYMDQESIFGEKAFIYYHWRKLGYDYKSSKLITIRGVEIKNTFYKRNPIYNEIIISPFYLNTKKIRSYITLINGFKPDFIHGYPSAIKNFCRIMREENVKLDIPIKGAFAISEEVKESDRNYIEETLNCRLLSFYGHTERTVFGEEINPGYYQFHKLYGHTELIPTHEENEYRIIATGFLNRKMPLIRYDTSDIAIVDEKGIRIRGAMPQRLMGKHGELIGLRTKVFQEGVFAVVAKCQFVQYEPGFVELNILDTENEIKKEKLKVFLQNRFDGVLEFKINNCASLELTSRGKEKVLIQHIKDLQ